MERAAAMTDTTLERLTQKVTLLVKNYQRLKKQNSTLKKQLALAQMEEAKLREKNQQAKLKIANLLNKLELNIKAENEN